MLTVFVTRATVAVAVVLLMCGALAVQASANAVKRLAALAIALMGALLAAAALEAPSSLLVAAVAAGFAQLAVGVALIVRMQESYNAIETTEIDAADAQEDGARPAP